MSSKPYFDQVASQWEQLRTGFFSDAVRDKALATAQVQPGTRAADIGAGSGFVTEALLQVGVEVIAVDQSAAMLDEMRKRFANAETVDYRVGRAEELPLDDATVDNAFANMYLHHVEEPAGAIREMARIVKPGGHVVITDLDEHRFEFLREEHHDRWMGFRREDVQHWFEAAGLRQVVVDCAGENCCAQSSGGSESASISIFIASGVKDR